MPDPIKQFLATLAERTASEGTPWYLTPAGRIRTKPPNGVVVCPLAYATNDPETYWRRAKHTFGMRQANVQAVMDAADNFPVPGPSGLRAALLKATGLA